LLPKYLPGFVQLQPRQSAPRAIQAAPLQRFAGIRFYLVSMMLAIDLDDELSRYAGEIGEVRTNLMLPAKLDAAHAMRAQQFPARLFSSTGISAKLSCALNFFAHSPSPSLSP